MSKLTLDEVRYVAKLANLSIPDNDLEKYALQLSRILEYIDQLNSVDITNIEPTFNVSGTENVFHKDETIAGLSQIEALSNAKNQNGFFVAKRVVGGSIDE